MAEGKEHALAIGITKMSTEEMYVLDELDLLAYLSRMLTGELLG